MAKGRFLMIVVLGCYRSGTSLVAGILHHLGVFMGEKFDDPSPANPKGFFEDIEFKRLFNMWTSGKEVSGLVKNLIQQRDLIHPLWGVKDPQMCLLLDRFLLLTNNVKVIAVHRSNNDICNSLSKSIAHSNPETYKPLVDYYLMKMTENLQLYQGEILNLNFDSLLRDRKEIEKISVFTNLPLNKNVLEFAGHQ